MSDLPQGLRFGILGPVTLWHGNREVDLATRSSRALLARLLLAADHAVHLDLIIDAVYGSMPPKSARNQIQKSATELRSQGVQLIERGGAYLMSSPPDALDASTFSELVARARTLTSSLEKAEMLRYAEALWRGPALYGLDAGVFRSIAAEWDEKRLAAIAERIEAEMLCQQHHQVIPELQRLVLENPTHESFHALLMIACHHAGRVSESARCYSALRYRLAEELGIDPPGMLQQIHEMILRQDRSLFGITTLQQIEALATRELDHIA